MTGGFCEFIISTGKISQTIKGEDIMKKLLALLLALGLLMAREYCLPDAEPTEPTSSYTEPTT